MQVRVQGGQPWDVRADVLVLPVVAGPIFDGGLGGRGEAGRRLTRTVRQREQQDRDP